MVLLTHAGSPCLWEYHPDASSRVRDQKMVVSSRRHEAGTDSCRSGRERRRFYDSWKGTRTVAGALTSNTLLPERTEKLSDTAHVAVASVTDMALG